MEFITAEVTLCSLSPATQTRAVNTTPRSRRMPHFRCSRNANIVVLDFPACTAPSRAWSNYSFSRFRGQRLTGRACPGAPFARPSAPSAPRTRAICLLFCAAKVIEPVALAPSARCKLGQSAWTENQLLAHHLHVHCLRPRGTPWHPVIPRCTSTTVISHFAIRGTRNAVFDFFFFFLLTAIGHNFFRSARARDCVRVGME